VPVPGDNMSRSHYKQGFTLLELVIVIALLAILAVMALPRMLNNYDDAHFSSVSATGGAFSTAVMLVRTQWVASGAKAEVDAVKSFGRGDVATTSSGWPSDAQQGSASLHSPLLAGDTGRCVRLWQSLLATHGLEVSTLSGEGVTYVASINDNSTCRYTYQSGNSNSRIEYNLSSGEVHTILQ